MVHYQPEGLIPAVVQDRQSGRVLMLAYMNQEALEKTLATGEAWFYSRRRRQLWHKGETSGSFLKVYAVLADCDADTILLLVDPTGPVCHTGAAHCFFQQVTAEGLSLMAPEADYHPPSSRILEELEGVIAERQRLRPPGSYVAGLLEAGIDRVGKKVIEEAAEAVLAAKNMTPEAIAAEVADLWFHALVLLAASGVPAAAVWEELRRRRR